MWSRPLSPLCVSQSRCSPTLIQQSNRNEFATLGLCTWRRISLGVLFPVWAREGVSGVLLPAIMARFQGFLEGAGLLGGDCSSPSCGLAVLQRSILWLN